MLSAIVETGSWNYGNMKEKQSVRKDFTGDIKTHEYKLASQWGRDGEMHSREKGKPVAMGNCQSLSIAHL